MPDSAWTTRSIVVDGIPMHLWEQGRGDPILFLHGNPTSSWLWRNVIPRLTGYGRCLAVDLPGMGASGDPPTVPRFGDHARALDGLIAALDLREIVIVGHDWGVALGIDHARRHPGHVRAMAMMEGHLAPIASWDDFDDGGRDLFRALRDPDIGHRRIVGENLFIDDVLPSGILRTLAEDEMEGYRAPFVNPARRNVIHRWVQDIPIAGEPADVAAILDANVAFLQTSPIPKLLLHAEPGAIVDTARVAWARDTIANLSITNVGAGLHFLPEDRPVEIATAIARWLDRSA